MATTLVIKEGNFSTNALTTVTLDTLVPCTGISLSDSTLSVVYGSTGTLTATVTPNDTTDLVEWSTSDATVATVSDGTITSVGVGTTTITATCGEYSVTCTVTVNASMNTSNLLQRVGYYMSGNSVASGGNGLPTWKTENVERGGFGSTTGNLSFYQLSDVFPYAIPQNTEIIKIVIESGSVLALDQIQWYNSATAASSSSTTIAMLVKTGSSSLNPTTDAQGNTVYSVSVPTNTPAIDMLAIGIKTTDYSTMTTAMLDGVTVEFLPAAA